MNAFHASIAACALAGCSPLIGADDLEYTLDDDGGVAAPPGECAGRAGPTPVNVEGKFCIDSTEVTYAQYLEFLDAPDPPQQTEMCAWNVLEDGQGAFAPTDLWPPSEVILNRPVTFVDWCDAWSYCQWAGKRLCGNVGGGVADFEDYDSVRTEFYYACSRGGERAFPYGDAFDPDACVSVDRSRTYDVGSFPRCQGGFEGIFDLSGNAGEWLDICEHEGPMATCREGSHGFSRQPVSFDLYDCSRDVLTARNLSYEGLGFRCCSDAL